MFGRNQLIKQREGRPPCGWKKHLRAFSALVAAAGLMTALAACGGEAASVSEEPEKTADRNYYHYQINESGDQLEEFRFKPESTQETALISDLLAYCEPDPDDNEETALFAEGVELLDYQVKDGVINLNMNAAYAALPKARELLVRAGLVKTMIQVEGISYVQFSVEGTPLRDSAGAEVGKLSSDNFVENAGRSIHSYQNAVMKLYFTDKTGSVLIPEERTVYFSSNEPVESAVVNELVRGTNVEGHYPTLSPETKVLSVVIQEGICYVNFDESFQNSILSVNEDVQIYSIVNSLVETCHVNRVQFTINGKSNMMFRQNMQLDKLYEKNEILEVES